MAYYKPSRKSDIRHFRVTSTRTKAVNRKVGNAFGQIRF